MADQIVVSTANANMNDYPAWLQATGGDAAIPYSAADDRGVIEAIFPTEGLLFSPTAFLMTQNGGGDNSVNIAAGRAVVKGDPNVLQGSYIVASIGNVNLPIPAAPGSGSRTHRIVAEVLDKQSGIGSSYGWQFRCIEDTGGGLPALPNSALYLGTVTRSVGVSTVLTAAISNKATMASPWMRAGSALSTDFGYAAGAPIFYGYQLNSQQVSFATWTAVNLEQEVQDPWDGHAGGSPQNYVAPITGMYQVSGGVCYATASFNTPRASTAIGARITVNGTAILGTENFATNQNVNDAFSVVLSRPRPFTVNRGDIIRMEAYNDYNTVGSYVNTYVGSPGNSCSMSVLYLG